MTNFKLTGIITFTIKDINGNVKDKFTIKNTITDAGLAGIASRINGADSESAFTYLALGTGTTSPTTSDTALETEITDSGLARSSATATRETTNTTDDTAQLEHTWTATASKAITECGMFNASSGGTMLGRQTFTAKNIASGETINVKYGIVSDQS